MQKTFSDRLDEIRDEAIAHIESIAKKRTIILFDPAGATEEEKEEAKDYLPEYQDYDARTHNLYAKIHKVYMQDNSFYCAGEMRDDDSYSAIPLNSLSPEEAGYLSDYIKITVKN